MTDLRQRLDEHRAKAKSHPFTDDGNATRLIERHRDQIRFVAKWGTWLTWDGRRWQEDPDANAVTNLCRRLLRDEAVNLHALAQKLEKSKEKSDTAKSQAYRSTARSLGALKTIRAAVSLAATDPSIYVDPDDLDARPQLLNVANGTIDLATGVLRAADPADLLTKFVDVNYVTGTESPKWESFLARVLPDRDVRDYVQTLVGYALTGHVREQVCVFLIGTGANGKTVFVNTLQHVFGEYHAVGRPDVLVATRNDTHPTYVARMKGARLVTIAELDQGAKVDEAQLKILTGGDRLEARRMREDPWEFNPTHQIVVMSNHKPEVKGTDEGIWRRIRLIPFDVTIPFHDRDPNLAADIAAEIDGVLAWAVEGATRYLIEGLGELPTHVDLATASFRSEQNQILRFCEDRGYVLTGKHTDSETFGTIWGDYQAWAHEAGERQDTQRTFGENLAKAGAKPDKFGGYRIRRGIRKTTTTDAFLGSS